MWQNVRRCRNQHKSLQTWIAVKRVLSCTRGAGSWGDANYRSANVQRGFGLRTFTITGTGPSGNVRCGGSGAGGAWPMRAPIQMFTTSTFQCHLGRTTQPQICGGETTCARTAVRLGTIAAAAAFTAETT
jgi:hypothetical protein